MKEALKKAGKVAVWIVTSGVATFALTSLIELIGNVSISMDAKLVLVYLVNILLVAITKYNGEGDDTIG
jgi:hypothetical protein